MIRTILKIDGMMCAMCEAHVNDVIRNNCTIKEVRSFAKKGETIILSEEELDINSMKEQIQELGYQILSADSEEFQEQKSHLPVYGVGPYYGIAIIALTIVGMILSYQGVISFFSFSFTRIPLIIVGALVVLCGFISLYVIRVIQAL